MMSVRRFWVVGVAAAALCSTAPARALPLGFGLGIRLGGATTRATGALAGVDVTVPGLALFDGFKGRIDLDTWGQLTSGWDRSSGGIAATFNQVVNGIVGYYGVGGGFSRIRIHGVAYEGPELKLIGGFNLLGMGFEVNYHMGKVSTWTGLVRFRF